METGAPSPRVLVVDDDPDVLASLERGLRLSGFEVTTAVDGGAIAIEELAHLPQISPLDPWWEVWLREAGQVPTVDAGQRGIRLDSQAAEGAAAMAGQGLAMLTPFFWRNDIAEGKLVQLFDQLSSRGYGYWLVCPAERRNVAKIKRFREWLVQEVAR